MNLDDVLKYGHATVLSTVDGLTDAQCDVSGVCGIWSVRQIIAHLASHELLMIDALSSLLDANTPTPALDAFGVQKLAFNDIEVEKRQDNTYAEIVDEYKANAARVKELAARIPLEQRRTAGLFAWYGKEYDLEDLVAYSVYGHKREHCAQINVYRDTLKNSR